MPVTRFSHCRKPGNIMPVTGFLGLVMVGLLVPALAAPGMREWGELTLAGKSAYARGDYEAAERLFAEALTEAERSGVREEVIVCALSNLGCAHQALGKFR